jgi:isomerase DpgB
MYEVSATVRSGRPFSADVVNEIAAACDAVESAVEPAALVLRILDVNAEADADEAPFRGDVHDVNRWERTLRRVERLCVPVLAIVAGTCYGLAADVLLVADHRVAGPGFRYCLGGRVGHTWPSMAVHRLGRQIGIARARPIVLFRATVGAGRAVDLGLVDEIEEDPFAAGAAVLRRWQDNYVPDIAVYRMLLLESNDLTGDAALGSHLAASDRWLRRHAAA